MASLTILYPEEFDRDFLRAILASPMLAHHLAGGADIAVAAYGSREPSGFIDAGFTLGSMRGGIVQRMEGGAAEWHT